jgi:hypothetical protein
LSLLLPFTPLFSTNEDVILPFLSSRGEEFIWDCWVLYNPV